MGLKKYSFRAIEILTVVIVLALIGSQLLGQPILLSYATSDSMEPTISAGDGYVVIPTQIAGPTEQGNVVVFRAKELHGGGLTVHRIVDETDRGYITKGDNNPATDQDGQEPPVKQAQIVGVVVQIGGSVLTIPELGTIITGTQTITSELQRRLSILLDTRGLLGVQGLAYLLFAASVLLYGIDLVTTDSRRRREREGDREKGTSPRLIVGIFVALLIVAATAAMVLPAGSYEFATVSTEISSPDISSIPPGETESTTFRVPNSGVLPVYVRLESGSDQLAVEPRELRVDGRSVANATVSITAPPEPGYSRSYLIEHRYLAVLPTPILRGLYEVHPWAPIITIDALIAVPFYLVGVALVGSGRIRRRSRSRDISTSTRVRRAVRNLYR